tara:strand:- start:8352 stop:9089 length:738 start_codon:yes stop_codon:yes gene_type:complete
MATYRQLKTSQRWNVQVRLAGEKSRSATFDTRAQAGQWAGKLEARSEKKKSITFLDIGLIYCNRALIDKPSYKYITDRVHVLAGILPDSLSKITRDIINDYRLMRLKVVKPVTVRDDIQLISRIYRCAYRELVLDEVEYPNPCQGVPMPPTSKPRNKVIRPDELHLLLSALPPLMQEIVELAYETAMRRGEIVKLCSKHLYLDERILSVIDGKTGDRSVPLTKRAVELLRESLSRCNGPEEDCTP